MNNTKYIAIFVSSLTAMLVSFGGLTVYLDPYIHYHYPTENYTYEFVRADQRYVNDGITKYFEYDSAIFGKSNAENFKTSDAEEFFGGTFIKAPASGARLLETNILITNALEYNENLTTIIRTIDMGDFDNDKDSWRYDIDTYPWYLWDNNIFNDVEYIFNKDIFFNETLEVFETQGTTNITSFDDYSNWNDKYTFGQEAVMDSVTQRDYEAAEPIEFTDEDAQRVADNVIQNLYQVAYDNPDVDFYYVLTPYSAYYWYIKYYDGEVSYILEGEKIALEILFELDNVKVYSYNNWFDITTNYDNYRDYYHFHEDIHTLMLEYMSQDIGLLTEDNYEAYLDEILEFYMNFDYDTLYPE